MHSWLAAGRWRRLASPMHRIAQLPTRLAHAQFPAMLAGVLGTAAQLQQAALWSAWVYGCTAVFALAVYAIAAIKNIAISLRVGCVVLAMAAFGFGLTGARAVLYLNHALDPALEGRDVVVTGVVANLPQRNQTGLRFRMAVESAQLNGQPISVPPRMDVGWYGTAFASGAAAGVDADSAPDGAVPSPIFAPNRQPVPVQAGERWQMTLRLKAPHGSRNPYGFDYELWLWEQGVQASAYVRTTAKDPAPVRLGQTGFYPVALARQMVRESIYRRISTPQTAGLLAALVVGDQNAIDNTDWDLFRATGVAHLVSVSGLHITMFAWVAALLVGWGWRRSARLCLAMPAPYAALLGGVVLASAYAVFSGWGVPAQRTCLMLASVAALRLCGLRWPWPQVWMLVCAVVVACDPWALLQPGFWLSFVAVGVLFASNLGASSAHPASGGAIKRHIVSGLHEQWTVTLALTPLTVLLFGQVSVVGLVANAVAIPWMTLLVTPLAMLGVVWSPLWDGAAAAVGVLLAYLQWLAAWPWAFVALAMPPLWAGMAGVVGGVLLVLPWGWRMRLLGVPLVLPVLLWQAPVPPPGAFELLAADVGQGNAVLVRTTHHALLYDAGPRYSLDSDAGSRVLVPLLQALHARLDIVLLSHSDTDHVGGAPAVLAMQSQAELLSSIAADHALQSLRPAQRCAAGQHWEWDGVLFTVLHPLAVDYETVTKPNALSCVLRVSNGPQTALLVGDIEQAQEARLLGSGTPLGAQVLLVPHHGSKTSSSAPFLDAVAPQWALVQSGYRNRFGHPAPSVLARYQERHIAVVDSPHCGAATWQSHHPDTVDCMRTRGLRYWHHRVP